MEGGPAQVIIVKPKSKQEPRLRRLYRKSTGIEAASGQTKNGGWLGRSHPPFLIHLCLAPRLIRLPQFSFGDALGARRMHTQDPGWIASLTPRTPSSQSHDRSASAAASERSTHFHPGSI